MKEEVAFITPAVQIITFDVTIFDVKCSDKCIGCSE